MQSGSVFTSLVSKLVEARAFKAYKISHLVGLKKTVLSLRFLRNAPTKKISKENYLDEFASKDIQNKSETMNSPRTH